VSPRPIVSISNARRSETARPAMIRRHDQEHEIIRRSLMSAVAIAGESARDGNHDIAASMARALKTSSDAEPHLPPNAACTR
jgi:hypothetical protein